MIIEDDSDAPIYRSLFIASKTSNLKHQTSNIKHQT